MPKRLLLALIILVAAPLVLLGWLSRTTIASQEWAARKSIDDLFQNQLAQHDRVVTSLFDRYKREFSLAMNSANGSAALLHALPQENPVARSVFVVDTKGNVLYPPPSSITFEDEVIKNRPSITPMPAAYSLVGKVSQELRRFCRNTRVCLAILVHRRRHATNPLGIRTQADLVAGRITGTLTMDRRLNSGVTRFKFH